jgi:hypothetical protein
MGNQGRSAAPAPLTTNDEAMALANEELKAMRTERDSA